MKKQLRIACLGDYDNYLSYFTYGVMEGSIRAGHLFRPVPFFNSSLLEIKKQILWFKPHILLTHMIFGCSNYYSQESVFQMLSELKNQGIFIAYHAGDARLNPRYKGDISRFADLGLLNQDNISYYSSIWKIPVIRWPYMCLYQDRIADPINIFKCRVAFTGELGAGVHTERTEFIHRLIKTGIDVKLFPTQQSGNTRFQTAELAASADTVLGMQMERSLRGYLDVRPFQYIGAGAVYLHDKCPQMIDYFIAGEHYLEYDKNDPHSVCAILCSMDRHPEMARAIRENGFKYCQAKHSTKERVEQIVGQYEEMV
jgi:hypothetical protein